MSDRLQAFVPGDLVVANERVCCDLVAEGRLELQCQICKYVLDKPKLLGCCGHHICEACVDTIQHSRIVNMRSCPFCKTKDFTTLLNKGILREINELKVHCPNFSNGCPWEGQLNGVWKHIDPDEPEAEGRCLFQPVKCKFPGCSYRPPRKDLHNHEAELCEFRSYTCKHCSVFTDTYLRVSTQHFPVCPDFPVACPRKCVSEFMPRSSVNEHLRSQCPLEEIACDYKSAGCNFVRSRKDMPVHCKAATQYHSKLLVEQNASLQLKLAKSQQQLEKVVEEQVAQNSRFQELLHQQGVEHQRQLSALERKLAELTNKVTSTNSAMEVRSAELKKESAEGKRKLEDKMSQIESLLAFQTNQITAEVNGIDSQITILKCSQEETNKLVSSVASNIEVTNQGVRDFDKLSKDLETVRLNQPAIVEALVDPTLNLLEVMRGDILANKSLMEDVRRDMEYVEKCITPQPPFAFTVSRYSERKLNREAYVSPSFYTHPRGYKVCMRVDVHSHDMPGDVYTPSSSGQISVYCCIMKGEHDDLLVWPFLGEIHVRIQNHLGDHNHFDKSIRYDENTGEKKSGRVVTGDKNYLHGFHQFISHQELSQNHDVNVQYLKGDAVDFEVIKVDAQS